MIVLGYFWKLSILPEFYLFDNIAVIIFIKNID